MAGGLLFEDRRDAGRQLAEKLGAYRDDDPLILALPRGGVLLGYEIAQALDAPLDAVVARKVGAPGQEEYGIGAVAPGVSLADERALRLLGLSPEQFERLAAPARREMERRLRLYRDGDDRLPDVEGRTVILVDDGLATGVTARAALLALRRGHPARLVLAVAVCARETARALAEVAGEVVCIAVPDVFGAVGLWYRDFSQNTDEEVLDLLDEARSWVDTS